MRITHVIRGEEWLPSTPKHIMLYNGFGWKPPAFAHLPLVLNKDRTKLSKRQADISVQSYKDKGYDPAALVNFVALLGWAPNSTKEVFSMAELIEEFDISNINTAPAVSNHEKLDWFNEQHMRRHMSTNIGGLSQELREMVMRRYPSTPAHLVSEDYLNQVIRTLNGRTNKLADIPTFATYFWNEVDHAQIDATLLKKMWSPNADRLMTLVAEDLEKVPTESFTVEEISRVFKTVSEKEGVSSGKLWTPARLLLMGTPVGPGVPETIFTLGKSVALHRLKKSKQVPQF
eukprot:TRINITY_DN6632_c0_g1_i1.p1 TRINITY_DN6632_c0_g1~~TRINITY_DN6632_c0_g1_i1.p1  ORF type:complete len:288 (+),score=64.70 TRINITY_DN6632_c0_g1_i1:563-1426(+)